MNEFKKMKINLFNNNNYRIKKFDEEVLSNFFNRESKELLGFFLASVLHEKWKLDDSKAYEVADDEKKAKVWEIDKDEVLRKFKPIDGEIDGKAFTDKKFIFDHNNPSHREISKKVDIRGLSFDELPIVWQKENADAGKVAVDLVFDKIMNEEEIDIEDLASKVHEAWLSRPNNAWAIEYKSEESKPYNELSEEVKAKDRRQVELAKKYVKDFKDNKITLEGLKRIVGPSMKKYNEQIRAIKEIKEIEENQK